MRKAFKIAATLVFIVALSACLFYCMVAGAGENAAAYVIMAAILSVGISAALCLSFLYIRRLQKQLKNFREKKKEF